jgi:multidrug resistance efflux pump
MKINLDIFKTLPALKAELKTLKDEKVTFTTKNTELQAKVDDLLTKEADYQKTIAAFPLAKQDWESQLEAVKKDYQTKIDGLTTDLEATKTSVNKEVTNQLASIGILEGTVSDEIGTPEAMTPEKALAQLKTLHGNARDEFYNTHRGLILQAARVK